MYNDPNDPNYRPTPPTFNFDENATRTKLLGDYAPLFNVKKTRLQEDFNTANATNQTNYDTRVAAKKRSLQDYIDKATNSFANRGLYNSGLRVADQTKAEDITNQTINEYLAEKQAQDAKLNTQFTRGNEDLSTLLSSKVDTGVAKSLSDAYSNYNSEYDKYNRYLSAVDEASSKSRTANDKYLSDLQDKAIKESLTKDLFSEAQIDENGNPRDLNAALADVDANRTSILKAGFTPAEIDSLKSKLRDQYTLQDQLKQRKQSANARVEAARAAEARTKFEGAGIQALAGAQKFLRGLPGFNLFKYGG